MKRLVPILALMIVAACGGSDSPTAPSGTTSAPYSQTDLVVGTGAAAAIGNQLTVSYAGWLHDSSKPDAKGVQFDSSPAFTFVLGGNVIAGWNQGVVGMRVGGRRRLVIPPELAYGSAGNRTIPPNATLVFDIELLSVQP